MFRVHKSFRDKVVLITGASGGFGRLFGAHFLRDGAYLILSDRTSIDLATWSQDLELPHGWESQVLGQIVADLADSVAAERLVDDAWRIRPVDVALLNAGLLALGYHEDIPIAHLHTQMDVMLRSPMVMTHALLRHFKARQSGTLVFIDSVAGFVATPYAATYNAAKFGLRGFAMAIAGEARRAGVSVSLIYPFFTRTSILQSPLFGSAKPPAMPEYMIEDAARVVDEAMRGLRQERLHIRTGRFAKVMWHATRLKPWIVEHKRMKG